MYLKKMWKLNMGQQLSWLEHTTDNREVDGSSPFWPTTSKSHIQTNQKPSEAGFDLRGETKTQSSIQLEKVNA